jgi:hypothetical protein
MVDEAQGQSHHCHLTARYQVLQDLLAHLMSRRSFSTQLLRTVIKWSSKQTSRSVQYKCYVHVSLQGEKRPLSCHTQCSCVAALTARMSQPHYHLFVLAATLLYLHMHALLSGVTAPAPHFRHLLRW